LETAAKSAFKIAIGIFESKEILPTHEIALDSLGEFGYFYRFKCFIPRSFLFRIVPPRQFKFKPRSYNPDTRLIPIHRSVGGSRSVKPAAAGLFAESQVVHHEFDVLG
jgi:hypothetical protein